MSEAVEQSVRRVGNHILITPQEEITKSTGGEAPHQRGGGEHEGERGGPRMGRYRCCHWHHPGDRDNPTVSLLLLLRRMRGNRPLGGESPKWPTGEDRSGEQIQPYNERPQRR